MVADSPWCAPDAGIGHEDQGASQCRQRARLPGVGRGARVPPAGDAGRARRFRGPAAPLAMGGRRARRHLHQRLQGHQRRRDARRGRRHAGAAGDDRRWRGQEAGLRTARGGISRQGAPCGAHRARRRSHRSRARGRVHARDLRDAPRGGAGGRARRACRRHRAAVAGVREPRYVPRLQRSRRGVLPSGSGARRMSAPAHYALLGFARSSARNGGVHLDQVTLALALGRVLVLVYLASYAVRRETQLRESFAGLGKPLGLLCCVSALLLLEPDFGAATVLFATGFALLFLAGARLRYVIAMTAIAAGGFAVLAVSASYRLRRLTTFLDPWADPYNTGFQLTQSLIAIGRGQWLGVGLGESVQKLFYLPEAHTDFLFAVLAEELGLLGVTLTLALFLGLIWRSFYIARLASQAGLRFPSLLAAGFGLWVGIQAFINIGVNMGALPTKGLTLPLMSYGRSSLIVGLAWVGLLLRVYHETLREQRGSATVRGAS